MTLRTETSEDLPCMLCVENKGIDVLSCIECSNRCWIEHNFSSKVCVCEKSLDTFEIFAGDIRIEDDGEVVVHGLSVSHASVRGKGQYSSGQHRLRFRIDCYNINKWIFFGIVSNESTIRPNTWAIPSSYGWGGDDSVILNRCMFPGFNHYQCDFELNDIIELGINCDKKIIFITNQRTKSTHQLDIDLNKSPFSWHFHLNLFYPNDEVTILSIES